jgi:three-Cys-motif partner protein
MISALGVYEIGGLESRVNMTRKCNDDCKDINGNCLVLGSDGFPVQCVGPWAEDKYYFLERYLNASCEARRKFADKGNAVYIDLFSGPGKCIVRQEQREIEGGAVRAFHRDEAPFNDYYYFDICEVNAKALRGRLGNAPNVHIDVGDSNYLITSLIKRLQANHYRYHFAFVDPFGPEGLKFETLMELAKLQRMDMLINFPIGAIKRNVSTWLKKSNSILDVFLGTDSWKDAIKTSRSQSVFQVLLDVFKKQLMGIGYPENGLKIVTSDSNIYSGLPTVGIKNTKEVDLYVLILASKHVLGQKIWTSVIKVNPSGQRSLF